MLPALLERGKPSVWKDCNSTIAGHAKTGQHAAALVTITPCGKGIGGGEKSARINHCGGHQAWVAEGTMMDQAIHNKIVSFIRGIEANFGSRSHIRPDSRTRSTDAKKK